jgi:Rhodopirellula transposase DDE domain
MVVMIDVEPIRERFLTVAAFLDERGRRLVAAAEAFAAGYGGIAAVAMATGMAPSTIGRGLRELAQDDPSERVRRPGAGRKPAICKDPTLLADLEALVEPTTRGDPGSPLRWTCKSVRRLAQALQAQGHQARQPDPVVHGSGDCGVEGRAPRHARRPTALLGVGDHHGADAAGGFPPGAAPDRRADRIPSAAVWS